MATFTISVSDEIKKRIDSYPEINWAEYLKQRFSARLDEFSKVTNNVKRRN